MNRFFYLGLLSVMATVGLGYSAHGAAPAFGGGTGLIMVPTAEILPERSGAFSFHTTDADRNSAGISYTLTPRIEVGLTSPDIKNNASDWRLNAKYNILGESLLSPALSVGLSPEGYYIVMSKDFQSKGMALHGGFGTHDFGGIFLGVEKSVKFARRGQPQTGDAKDVQGANPVDGLSGLRLGLIAEYYKGSPNFGFRLNLSPNIAIDGGLKSLNTPVFGISFWSPF